MSLISANSISFNLHKNFKTWVLVLLSSLRWGHWGKKRLRNWPMFTQPVGGWSQDLKPGSLASECMLLSSVLQLAKETDIQTWRRTLGFKAVRTFPGSGLRFPEGRCLLLDPAAQVVSTWAHGRAGWPTVLKATTTLLRQGLEFISSTEHLLRASEIYQDLWDPTGVHDQEGRVGEMPLLWLLLFWHRSTWEISWWWFIFALPFSFIILFGGVVGVRGRIYILIDFFSFLHLFLSTFQIFLLFNSTHILPTTQEDNWWDYVCSEKRSDYATTPEEECANESWWQEQSEFPFPSFS